MKSDFETQWEREFERSMQQKPPAAFGCFGGCAIAAIILWLACFFSFWLMIELAERL